MFKKARRPGSKLAGWKFLTQAQQYAYHPMLVELQFERDALARAMCRNEAMETFEEGNPAATDQLVIWKKRLEQDENWRSFVGRESSRMLSTSTKIGILTIHFQSWMKVSTSWKLSQLPSKTGLNQNCSSSTAGG
ncbi:hypothetical protein FNYG_01090 [Fusarium nygamai]|uniref:Uncharacterized protein n=1 Tax=Gibberella nygamai TaxID=42673 RepID=A0A2K0WUU6_GIBNY|nr:hypothetical protein FNYG_01090 [Fusarium nygamai]